MSGPARRWVVRLVKAILIAYVVGLAILFALQRQLLFPGGKEPPSLKRAGLVGLMEPIEITTADGLTLLAWYHKAQNPDSPLILLLHGNGGTIEIRAAKAKTYIDAGYGVLMPEYRGYGGNPGSPSEDGLYADGRAALAFAAAQGVAPGRVVLLGESLGTGVAVQMAVEQRVAALVLQAPYSSIADVAQADFPLLPVWWLVRDRFDSVDKIARVGVPLLVVHGERDEVVPVRFGRALFAAASEPKEALWLPGSGHGVIGQHAVDAAVVDFLERKGVAPSGGAGEGVGG
jgi:fermentation-respiration switch protein FrsA (DUF1100 family)